MSSGFEISRRKMMVGLLSTTAVALADVCNLTPRQGEGPYYPESDLDRDSDLTSLEPGGIQAKGQVIRVTGKVTTVDCTPIRDALVEIWQACESGKYNHSEDPNNLPLDKNFQYWGRARTDADGKYVFRSIIPGHYPVGGGAFRPPHIHFKVHAAGFISLTTQMYFDPNSYDDPKLKAIVTKLNAAENVDRRLTVLFSKPTVASSEKGGIFDITLRRN